MQLLKMWGVKMFLLWEDTHEECWRCKGSGRVEFALSEWRTAWTGCPECGGSGVQERDPWEEDE